MEKQIVLKKISKKYGKRTIFSDINQEFKA